jgi:ADP-ribose pyrophosphatase YjhB (NUDIX family)
MEELRDANGLTEREFLATYDASKYDRPSVTVDIICITDGKILLVRRGGHPCIGKLAFPGGFVEMDEDVYAAALRELYEETELKAKSLRQLRVASEPNRDPRTRIITVPFLAEIEDASKVKAGDDAMSAKWYSFSYKTYDMGKTTFFEINIASETNRYSVKVSKTYDKNGIVADPTFKTVGDSPLAGDHAEILAMALDSMQK